MTPATFFKQFDMLADAPNAVAKLRELILQMAVMGKLVPQDPKDEPAGTLLSKCAEERASHGPQSTTSSSRLLPPVEVEEMTFDAPIGWEWVRMCHIADHRLGKMLDKGKNKGQPYPYLRNTNVQWLRFDLADVKEMRFQEDELDEYQVRRGDLLVCEGGEPGRCAIWRDQMKTVMFQKAIHRVRPFAGIMPEFLQLRLWADARSGCIDMHFTGATIKHFTGKELAAYAFALPPLPEQRRIVAKVDELMGLCDELESRLERQRESRQRLSAATLDRLLSAREPAEFAAHWQRICGHFDLLYDAPETIGQLRQAILQLAVQGKLVPQDPGDESAAKLIATIKAEKAELIRQKKLRASSSHTLRDRGSDDHGLPVGWERVTLDEISDIGTGSTPLTTKHEYYTDGTVPWVTSAATNHEFIEKPERFVTELAVSECGLKFYPAGSLIVALYGQGKTRGQVGQLMFNSTTNQACAVVVFFGSGIHVRDFIRLLFKKKYQELREMAAGGAQPNLSGGMIRLTRIPFPPLAEQRRIVAKVDHLMSLCDALEAKLQQSQGDSQRLLAAAVHQLLNGTNPVPSSPNLVP